MLQTTAVDWIQTFSSAVLAFFTVVLAIATWKYYEQTQSQTGEISRQTTEMNKARKLKDEPRMKAGVMPFHGPNICLGFANIGGGIAEDVHATFWVEGSEGPTEEWGNQIHFPDDVYKIGFPLGQDEYGLSAPPPQIRDAIEGENDTLIVRWDYQDVAGNTLGREQRFSILDKLDEKVESNEFYLGQEREVRF
jgi:hypothetical protein